MRDLMNALFRPTLLFVSAATLAACATQTASTPEKSLPAELVQYTEQREPCDVRSATRIALFGDLHIHTAYSYDARPRGTETTPMDAYRFARGEPIPVPPYDDQGSPAAVQQLQRPLDFAAVTDHSEFFGEMTLCYEPTSSVFQLPACRLIREGENEGMFPLFRIVGMAEPHQLKEVCGKDGEACKTAANSLWRRTQEMAEAAYDRSASCAFTTFVGYEYTGTPNSNNIHRNVLFRNAVVPERAVSYIESPSDRDLWQQLSNKCLEPDTGCDVLAIPHNSNLSSGAMFPSYIGRFESTESARAIAEMRNAMEPVMEIFQHKGNSECFNGLPNILGAPDELCDMEQVIEVGRQVDVFGESRTVTFCEDNEVGSRGFLRVGCVSKNDFFRSVLLTGLQDEAVLGVNSYKLGVIASTDTHLSLAGDTDEEHWKGHLAHELPLQGRLTNIDTSATHLAGNPGGLAGVWAVENSRDAIFEALRRREVFGTTGTRISPRLFGGWDVDSDACELTDRPTYGYSTGVPMGGDLPQRPAGAKPKLFAMANADVDGAPLQKLQLIKGWVADDGQSHYQVFDIAGHSNGRGTDHHNSATGEIDLESGYWNGPGESSLCQVFEDPQFDPAQPAYYYLRAVEVPSLRWSWRACLAVSPEQRPAECNNHAPKTIQEMAWTSPIWYLPETDSESLTRQQPHP